MISTSNNHWPIIYQAYEKVCNELAAKIVEDGEGATRTAELKVEHAFSFQDADSVARGVANSPLVKTAIFAADPNSVESCQRLEHVLFLGSKKIKFPYK